MNRTFVKILCLSGVAGITLYSVDVLPSKDNLANASASYTSTTVKATVVDVSKLPQQARTAARVTALPATQIPIGRKRLAEIKRNPLSAPEGAAAAKAVAGVKSAKVPPLIGSGGRKSIGLNCVGNPATGFAPSDSHGTVGTNHYVEVTNVDLGIYNKAACGAALSFVSLKSFFGITDAGTTAFDPRAIYDFVNDRYVVTAETRTTTAPTTDQFQYFAVSRTGNPLGAWNIYRIPLSEGSYKFCKKAISDFWDYPNLGYNKDQWFITANNFPTSGAAYGAIMTIDKAPTLTGSTPVLRCYGTGSKSVQFNTAPPLDRSATGTVAYFLSPGSGAGNQLLKYTLNTSTAAMTYNTPIPIPAWTAPPDAPQPGTALLLDTIDGRFQSNTVQIGRALFATHAVNVSGLSGVKLYQVNAGTNTATVPLVWTTFASNVATWNPSYATQNAGGTTFGFLTFSYSGVGFNPSASMISGSNNGTTSPFSGFTYISGVPMTSNCQTPTRCRWGDYSATSLDPNDLNRAFGVNQYLTGGSQFNWTTRIMELREP